MRITWTDKVSNEKVFERAEVERKLMCELRARQMRFLGHILRQGGLENLVWTGRIKREKKQGEEEDSVDDQFAGVAGRARS